MVQRVIDMYRTCSSASLLHLFLVAKVKADGIQAITLGGWPAPFGISMVSDMLSALLVTTTILMTLFVVII